MERRGGMTIARCLLVGLLATVTMDVGSIILRKAGITAGLEPRAIGRWFSYLLRGRATHQTILTALPVDGELPLALVGHYLIGVTLALVFGVLVRLTGAPSAGATIALALGFGMLTNLLPWLVMFPAMGFDLFGRTAPPALELFRSSLISHVWFGLGLGVFTTLLR